MSWTSKRHRGLSAKNYRRVKNDIAVLKKTGETTDFLAKKAAKYEWVMKEAYPMLYPPPPESDWFFGDFVSTPDLILASASAFEAMQKKWGHK